MLLCSIAVYFCISFFPIFRNALCRCTYINSLLCKMFSKITSIYLAEQFIHWQDLNSCYVRVSHWQSFIRKKYMGKEMWLLPAFYGSWHNWTHVCSTTFSFFFFCKSIQSIKHYIQVAKMPIKKWHVDLLVCRQKGAVCKFILSHIHTC